MMPLIALSLLPQAAFGAPEPPRAGDRLTLRNTHCAIEFDPTTGALLGLENLPLQDQVLKGDHALAAPFRVHADFAAEWLLDTDPEVAAQVHLGPGDLPLARVERGKARGGEALTLTYEGGGLQCVLRVTLAAGDGDSQWTLAVRNTGDQPRAVVLDFPRLDGVRLGPPGAPNLQTVLNQAGYIAPAWSHGGGVYGNGGQWSMQWHALYDPQSGSALGLIVEDPAVRNKRLVLAEPSITVRSFPPRVLAPGETLELPPVRLLLYQGDWKRAARAYARWYAQAFTHAQPPQWFRECDGCDGRHFKKRTPGAVPDYGGQFLLDSFRELPAAHLRIPFDNLEYAFWSRGSMLTGKHTDGDNVIREDLGGPEAMHDGIAGLHRLGLHATLYIEGYIVSMESDLAKEGKAQRWSVMDRAGSIDGPYTAQGFYHMCPGCVEWQDHLVSVVSRVLRETGGDGVRLDSLGFYFLPCYNPEHHHATPFGYNEWVQQLLAKVSRAARAVNPQALLTTEAPVDFYGQWFHGALTQVYPRGLPPMRLAVGPYRPFVYAPGGPVWGSVSGFAGGRSCWEADLETTEGNWLCAQAPVHDTIVWGDVADVDPPATDPEIVTRRYVSDQCDAVVATRPACQDLTWPQYTKLADRHGPYEVLVPWTSEPPDEIAVCDIETLHWRTVRPQLRDGALVIAARSNWVLAVIPRAEAQVVAFDPLPEARPGDDVTLRLEALTGPRRGGQVEIVAPGLEVGPHGKPQATVSVGDSVTIRVPPWALPGWYGVRLRGQEVLGVKRLLHVVPAGTAQAHPLDYGRSYAGWFGQWNSPRIQVQSRCIIVDDTTGAERVYLQGASCKSEHTFAREGLFHDPDNYDFLPVFGDEDLVIFRRHAQVQEGYAQVRRLADGPFAEIMRLLVEASPVRELRNTEEAVRATRAGLPIIAQTEIANAETHLRAIIEYPVLTMNTNAAEHLEVLRGSKPEGTGIMDIPESGHLYQVDTGPVLFPDLTRRYELPAASLSLAYVAFHSPDWAEFIIEAPTPIVAGGQPVAEVYHYSRVVRLPARNRLFCIGDL